MLAQEKSIRTLEDKNKSAQVHLDAQREQASKVMLDLIDEMAGEHEKVLADARAEV